MKLFLVIATIIFSFFIQHSASAETVWCRNFKMGCLSEDEKDKAIKNCQNLAIGHYQDTLQEALGNPSLWRLGGYRNAQDYAKSRARNIFSLCEKDSL